jgi:cellulose synthase (UDP-forming)
MKLARLIQLFILSSVLMAILITSGLVLLSLVKTLFAFLHIEPSTWIDFGTQFKTEDWLKAAQQAWDAPSSSLGLPILAQGGLSLLLIASMLSIGTLSPKRGRQTLILLTLFCISRHMLWRATATLSPDGVGNMAATSILFVGELMAYVSLLLGYFQLWDPTDRVKNPPTLDQSDLPHVDVMVCTYNEQISVLYRTLVGCNALQYPNKTIYLLDDGDRMEMRQLAQHLGVQYLRRDSNLHAKAGNLNHALTHSQGDLVLVLDADHVPTRFMLNEVVGFFQEEAKLAFVQTPQHFFSLDPFQRNLVAEHVVSNEQDFFYHVIQPGNDHWGATFFAGTGAVFRRNALESIGGFATQTITEDTHTGIRLHAKGWKSVMYNKNLTAGMAQDSFADFVKQRLRWAKGMTQITFHDHPLFIKGLTLPQRVCYASGVWYFFSGPMRIIFMMTPLLYLLFGLQPIQATLTEIFIYYVPSFVALYWGYSLLSKGTRHLFWSEVYETSVSMYHTIATYSTLFSPFKSVFNVTPKGELNDRISFQWKLVYPQLLLSLAIGAGLIVSACRAFENPAYLGGLFTNFFWGVYNLSLLLGSIYVAQERPQYRLAPRVNKQIRCELRLLDGTIAVGYITNLSENGVAITFAEPIPVAGTLALKILDWGIDEVSLYNVQVIRSYVNPETKEHSLGLRIVNRTDAQHQSLVRHMFSSASVWNHTQEATWGQSLLSMLNSVFRLNKAEEKSYKRRTPRFQVYLPAVVESIYHGVINTMTNEVSETGISIVLPAQHPFKVGDALNVKIEWSNSHTSSLATVIKRIIPFQKGQVLVGVNFVRLSRQERLEVIEQIYGPREGLIRIAPATGLRVPCIVRFKNGQSYTGMTSEMSEMGVRVYLDRPVKVIKPTPAQVEVYWKNAPMVSYKSTFIPTHLSGEAHLVSLLYFDEQNLATIDDISRRLQG